MRSTIAQWDAESLCAAHGDVGPHLAGWCDQREAEQIGGDGHPDTGLLCALDERTKIVQRAGGVGRLHQRAEHIVGQRQRVEGSHPQRDSQRLGARSQHVERLGKHVFRDQEHRGRPACRAAAGPTRMESLQHGHGFGRRGRLVQERSRRDRQTGQIGHHGLEVEQRFEPTLGDLGLIGRVRRVPARILQHVAPNHGGHDAVVVAQPDEGPEHLVLRRNHAQAFEKLVFALRWREIQGP